MRSSGAAAGVTPAPAPLAPVSGRVEGATVNWEQADTIGVTYDTGGGNVLPVLPHADNAEIYSVALCKGCKTCYTNNRRSK